MTIKSPVKVLVSAAIVLLATIATQGVAEAAALTTTKTNLQYFVSPHPDDIYSAWGMVQHSTGNYPVFVVATAGEKTGFCQGQSVTVAGYGTYSPVVKNSTMCKNARMASLNAWFDDQTTRDKNLDNLKTVTPQRVCFAAQSSTIPLNTNNDAAQNTNKPYLCANYLIGANSARVEFDLGDGNLTKEEVNWAIKNVRAKRSMFPVTKEYGVVAAGYYNTSYSGCGIYGHADHYALHSAVYNTEQFPDDVAGYHPQFGATCASDPDYKKYNYSKSIVTSDYAANMTPSTGMFQIRFGWLTSPYWTYGTQAQTQSKANAVFTSDQYFWVR